MALDWDEVTCGWSGLTVTITHRATGLSVRGNVPRRRYRPRLLQDELLKLRRKLLAELGREVGRARRRTGSRSNA